MGSVPYPFIVPTLLPVPTREGMQTHKQKKLGRAILGFSVLALTALAVAPHVGDAGGSFNKGSCTFNGKKLYGRIQAVGSSPDVRAQIVTSSPDVRVQQVSSSPSGCGRWQMVDSSPDTRVQFVTSSPDVRIQYVSSSPGV
jgi:uncharacterized Zn-binding protein involved in type VI secretion